MLSLRNYRAAVVLSVVLLAGSLGAHRVAVELGVAFGRTVHFRGVPLEYMGIVWAAIVVAMSMYRESLPSEAQLRSTVHDWWLGIVGISGVLYIARALGSSRVQEVSVAYYVASLMIVTVFVASCLVGRHVALASLKRTLIESAGFLRRPLSWSLIGLAVLSVVAGPRSPDRPEAGPGFERWFATLPTSPMPEALRSKPITLVEFVDYQCPACKARSQYYDPVLTRMSVEFHELFSHVRVDFPLDSECNGVGARPTGEPIHEAACEAAVVVRLAREEGHAKEKEVIKWLWDHQTGLTTETVLVGLPEATGLHLGSRYGDLLSAVSKDAAIGRQLGVAGTPAYFLNGKRLPPSLSAVSLEAAIRYEYRALGRAR